MVEKAVDVLNSYRDLVWPEVNSYLHDPLYPNDFSVDPKYKSLGDFHWKLLREYPERRGKYIRPTLLLLTCEAMGSSGKEALKTAAAMQISEEWLLIHDDLEDGSKERRGKATLHNIYGTELAVNAGDALHVIMWKVLSDNYSILGTDKTNLLMDEFYKILSRTTFGQTAELKWTQENKFDVTDEDWFFVCDGKTSYYTIAGPMRLGAIISGATQKQLDSISEFGIYLGRCFQLVDDILDLTSDFGGLKKQQGNDIYEGKKTVMVGHVIRNSTGHDHDKLLSVFKKKREDITPEEVNWVISTMNKYGSIQYGKELAMQLRDKSYDIFKNELNFLWHSPARGKLESLIHFVLERDH